jgi:hypothetical protein
MIYVSFRNELARAPKPNCTKLPPEVRRPAANGDTMPGMGIDKTVTRTVLLLFIAALTYAADKRNWKEGTLVSMEAIEHRYQCVVSDGVYSYTVEYQDPIKAVVHRPVKFVIEKDQFILLDSDGKERWGRIEKRERVLVDPPEPRF